jgi:predicted small secreted protein
MNFRSATRCALVAVAALWLAGCNTIEGIGKDIGKAGDKIEETAKKSK